LGIGSGVSVTMLGMEGFGRSYEEQD
jgi:hypothetical protein